MSDKMVLGIDFLKEPMITLGKTKALMRAISVAMDDCPADSLTLSATLLRKIYYNKIFWSVNGILKSFPLLL